MMQRALRPSTLVPRGFDVESALCDSGTTVITVRPTSKKSLPPGCGASSGRIHILVELAVLCSRANEVIE